MAPGSDRSQNRLLTIELYIIMDFATVSINDVSDFATAKCVSSQSQFEFRKERRD